MGAVMDREQAGALTTPPQDIGEILNRARDIAGAGLAADALAVDQEARWPARGLRALQQAGLGGLVVPAASGGG